jgi:hypothetical protein
LRTKRLRTSLGLHAELGVGLHAHLVGAAELVEVVDVQRAERGLQRPEHVARARGRAASPARGRRPTKICGTPGRNVEKRAPELGRARDRRSRLCTLVEQRVAPERALVLELQLEAAAHAEPWIAGGTMREHVASWISPNGRECAR